MNACLAPVNTRNVSLQQVRLRTLHKGVIIANEEYNVCVFDEPTYTDPEL